MNTWNIMRNGFELLNVDLKIFKFISIIYFLIFIIIYNLFVSKSQVESN